MDSDLAALLVAEGLPETYLASVDRLHRPLAARIAAAARTHGPGLRVGICGAQGSGKTTGARVLALLLAEAGLSAIILSLDDLYLPLADRQRLAREVHPLLATRGVPGTHDVALGLLVLDRLGRAGETVLPRFDKARDDRAPRDRWTAVEGPAGVILFEGWCVGARPQDPAALAQPINALEREEDKGGRWRAYVNAALAGPYRPLFDPLDLFVLFAAPSFEVVLAWRMEQEHKLKARLGADAGMTDAALARFVAHYERLTRHILAEAPPRADILVTLGADRTVAGLRGV